MAEVVNEFPRRTGRGTSKSKYSKYFDGQVWKFHADELLGPALIAAQAEATEGATVRTVIELTRKVG